MKQEEASTNPRGPIIITMPPQSPSSAAQWLLSATIILSLVSNGNSFQTIGADSIRQQHNKMSPTKNNISSVHVVKMSSSFQQARLEEQLRLSTKQRRQAQSEEETVSAETSSEDSVPIDSDSSLQPSDKEEAKDLLELENEILGPDGLPELAPMMTYQKYLTMQEKRVRVTIRYSAEAGLRPFYLTVANQIKATHPDVLLEKRILPPVGSDAGSGESVFEVLVDGKVVIGKKKTKFLKVSSRSSGSSGDGGGKGEDGKSDGEKKKSGISNTPNIAGGRSIFVSMEKFEHELVKARKKRRPNTMYKSKEDALRGAIAIETTARPAAAGGDNDSIVMEESISAMTEAVMRLEKLKALSTRNREKYF